ncbi:hypothetical protein BAMY6639_15610 [Bacillus amyloliquefaciens UMAF6639]|nr:hypothetical protein BAMY6639_15610 [Bacillus amyloliquefaciens UMAF6639]AMQ75653.1 hypothetical protein BAMY6614_08150 [Bacillus amyloliquefaciens UMAF6614]ERH58148.1 hypothetical protein O205_17185 [Bacillus amyloliquefaciens EGD-AQ14]
MIRSLFCGEKHSFEVITLNKFHNMLNVQPKAGRQKRRGFIK